LAAKLFALFRIQNKRCHLKPALIALRNKHSYSWLTIILTDDINRLYGKLKVLSHAATFLTTSR
jgi:hypothetical protein